MKFVIDRKTWFRGEGSEESKLLREDGRMCCIGQIAEQCSVPRDSILNVSDLHRDRFHGNMNLFPAWFRIEGLSQSPDLSECYGINDDQDSDDDFREAALKKIFAHHGDELEFVN
jgi:hypothetical protein